MLIIKVFTLILIFNFSAFSQWTKADINTNDSFYSLYYDGINIYAGTISFLYYSTNNGQTWRKNSPVPELENEIVDILRTGNRIFVATFDKGVFETTDFGATWIDRNSGLGEFAANYGKQFALRGDSLYLATQGAGIFVLNLQNSLPSWLPFRNGMPLNTSSNVNTIINHKNRLIAGAGGNALVFTNDWGTSLWNNYAFDNFNGSFHPMYSLLSYGNTLFGSSIFGIYRSTNNGLNWQKFDPGNGMVELHSITNIGSDIYIFRTKTTGLSFIYKTTNFGTDWELYESFNGIYIHDAVSVGHYLYTARDSGIYYKNTQTTSVEDNYLLNNYSLSQNFPNPFNPVTIINYQLAMNNYVTLKIYDILGNEVATLVNEEQSSGYYKIEWDASSLSSGVYFYTILSGDFVSTKKMLLLK